jgi:pimeloyl-ACP methyl ester carboxylesterase
MLFWLDLRQRNVGGPVVPGVVSYDDGSTGVEIESHLAIAPRVVIATHGFNVNHERGVGSLRKLSELLGLSESDALLAVLWPGDHQLRAVSYPVEGRDADDSAVQLVRFLDRVTSKYARPTISLVAHSLGSRVVLEAAVELLSDGWHIEQVCLLAAAVNDFCLATSSDYRVVSESVTSLAVLASRKDFVLRFAYPVGNFMEAFLFFGHETGKALGYHGARGNKGTEEAVPDRVYSLVIPSDLEVGHGDYLPSWNSPPTRMQRAAAEFARAILSGKAKPDYALPP